MADRYTGADALGIYRSGTVGGYSLGGAIRSYEIPRVIPMIDCGIPGVRALWCSAKHAEGTGTIVAMGTDSLAYIGPDGTIGATVSIASGETKLLESNDTGYAVRVMRMNADDLGSLDTLTFRRIFNGPFAMSNVTNAQRVAGVVTYRGIFLKNHAVSGNITGIKINIASGVTGLKIATETPVGNAIQAIESETTAPAGLSFDTVEITPSYMAPGDSIGLWLQRTITAGTAGNAKVPCGIKIEFVYGGVTYMEEILQYYRIQETDLDLYELFATDGTVTTDWTKTSTSRVATSSTLPFTAVAPIGAPHSWYCTITKRNAYDLQSVNRAYEIINVDAAGVEIPTEVSPPENIELAAQLAAKTYLRATYRKDQDLDPADYFAYRLTTDGSDPSGKTPVYVAIGGQNGIDGLYHLNVKLGPYTHGTVIKALVTMYRSSDTKESRNTTQVTETIDTALCTQVLDFCTFFGEANSVEDETQPQAGEGIYYLDQPNNIYFDSQPGSISLYADTTLIWRAIWEDQTLYINGIFGLVQETISGTGDGSAIETVAWNGTKQLAVNVGTTRRCLIDIDNAEIQADTYIGPGPVATSPIVSVPYSQTAGETIFLVWDAELALWNEYLDVDSSGVWTTNLTIDQSKTQTEIEGL